MAALPRGAADLAPFHVHSPISPLEPILMGDERMDKNWWNGEESRDGFTSLEAIQVSPVQPMHPRNPFAVHKANLMFDFKDVQEYVSKSAPEYGPALASFYADPFKDPNAIEIISPAYFPHSEELIRK